ncbi:MAG TPA: hypothetical protein VGM90_07940 [Kofleriaceae bacterium]|jgi:hypothetical protein
MRAYPAIPFLLLLTASLVACGDDGGQSPSNDAAPDVDAPDGTPDAVPDAPAGSLSLTISGVASEISTSGTSPLAGVVVTAYASAGDVALGMATSGADGSFSIAVSTNAASVDGYLKATFGTTYKDTYLYPPHPLTADYPDVPVFVLSANTYSLANALLQDGQQATNGWIAMVIEDAAGVPVAGATTTSSPMGTVNYNGSSGLPSKSAASTASDGIAYDTNIAAGDVSVMAAKTGATFLSHTIKVRPDVVTMTLVTE